MYIQYGLIMHPLLRVHKGRGESTIYIHTYMLFPLWSGKKV